MNGLRTLGRAVLTAAALVSGVAAAGDAVSASKAWARATPPGMDVAAVYLTLRGGKETDRLVSASTPRAQMVHLHKVEQQGSMSQMRPVESLPIPAGGTVQLAPQSLHLMLMGVAQPLVAGQHFPLTLRFAKSAAQTVDVEVRAATASDEPASHDQH